MTDDERKDREHIISEDASWEEMLERFEEPNDAPSEEIPSDAPSDSSTDAIPSDEIPPDDGPSAEPARVSSRSRFRSS